jgi:zinc protease
MPIRKTIHRRFATGMVALIVSLAAPQPGFTGLGPTVAEAQRAELQKFIQRKVLSNGLEVIVVENHGVPLVTVELNAKNGSFTQTPEYAGLAHMYEHMFFKANTTYPEPDRFIERASEFGAVFNGRTEEERVNYYLTLPADSMVSGIKFLAAALKGPLFLKEELDRERQVVIGEYDRQESNPMFRLTKEMDKLLYPGNFSRKNVIGDREVIATTTPEKMRYIQSKYYVPNNCVLIVAGDVSPAAAFTAVENELGNWRRGEDPFVRDPIPEIPSLTKNDAVIAENNVGAITVLLQWQGPSVGKDPAATYAADVFSDVLNDPRSKFQQRLVDSGLWQGVLVNYYTLNHTGPITISGQTTPEKFRQAYAAMLAEVGKFTDSSYFDAEELAATKAHRAVTTAFGQERASEFAHTLGFWWAVASLEYYMGYVDNMAAQTVTNLRDYAQKYIVGKSRITGVLISPTARQSLKLTTEQLIGGGAH